MLRIGVCTGRVDFGSYVEDLLKDILWEYGEWCVEKVSVESLLDDSGDWVWDYHIFCLDEQVLTQQEVKLVTCLKRMEPETSFILLEGSEEQGIGGVRYHLFAYHLKRMQQQDLETELVRQWKRANSALKSISIMTEGKRRNIPLEQVMYIESNNRKVLLHTPSDIYEYYEKMYVLEEMLREEGFVRCHQSYMVSKHYVTDYNSTEIYLNQIVLPIGRKYREQVYKVLGREIEDTDLEGVREADCEQDNPLMEKEKAAREQDKPLMKKEKTVCEQKKILTEKQGVLTGVAGGCQGTTICFRPEQRILIGRDRKTVDVVVNLPKVSRIHCVIVYHQQNNIYEITDFSRNGTYLSGGKRLVPDTAYCVKPGTRISFGDVDNIYCLG
jgi:DNA-binding LytR/AlgR family response regulator